MPERARGAAAYAAAPRTSPRSAPHSSAPHSSAPPSPAPPSPAPFRATPPARSVPAGRSVPGDRSSDRRWSGRSCCPRCAGRRRSGRVVASALFLQNCRLAADSVDYYAAHDPASIGQHLWSLSLQVQGALVLPEARALPLADAALGDHPHRGVARVLDRPHALSCGVVLDVAGGFPGYRALWPVLAACAVLLAGRTGDPRGVDRLFASAPLQHLGRPGFALYLWHWPVFTLGLVLTHRSGFGLEGGLAVVAISLVLAHHGVDRPVRAAGRAPVRGRHAGARPAQRDGLVLGGGAHDRARAPRRWGPRSWSPSHRGREAPRRGRTQGGRTRPQGTSPCCSGGFTTGADVNRLVAKRRFSAVPLPQMSFTAHARAECGARARCRARGPVRS